MPSACAATVGREKSSVRIAIWKPWLTSPITFSAGTRTLVEDDLARGRAADAHLVFLATEREALHVLVDEEGR